MLLACSETDGSIVAVVVFGRLPWLLVLDFWCLVYPSGARPVPCGKQARTPGQVHLRSQPPSGDPRSCILQASETHQGVFMPRETMSSCQAHARHLHHHDFHLKMWSRPFLAIRVKVARQQETFLSLKERRNLASVLKRYNRRLSEQQAACITCVGFLVPLLLGSQVFSAA